MLEKKGDVRHYPPDETWKKKKKRHGQIHFVNKRLDFRFTENAPNAKQEEIMSEVIFQFFFFLSANKTWHNDSENQSDCRLTNSKFSFQIIEAAAVVDDDENVAEDEEALVEEAGDEDAGDQMEEANDNPNANNNGNNEEENVNQNAR